MLTLEEIKEVLGTLPSDVDKDRDDYDEYYAKEFLKIMSDVILRHGKEWCKEHAGMLNSQWSYARTLV